MKWQIDPTHTSIGAKVKHMMVSTVRGSFAGATGTIDFDPAAPEQGSVELRIPAASIDTGDVVRAFNVPKNNASNAPVTGDVLVTAARVVDVSAGASSGDTITVSLLVTQDDAQTLVAAASQGTVSLGVLPKTAVPVIDFQSKS